MKHPPQNIAFELSNRCNYSQAHTRCPNDAKADPIFLKTKIITDIIDYFGRVGLAPGIYVNIYNEPTIDPRLFWIYQYIIEHCDSLIYLFTNGWSINQYMLDEIMKFNVGFVVISVYSDSEEERINKLQGEKLIVQRIILDPLVMQIYDGPPNCHGPCTFPSVYPMINHKGQLGLCCRDYEWREIIADLNEISFEKLWDQEGELKYVINY